jgi:hypothetical protein
LANAVSGNSPETAEAKDITLKMKLTAICGENKKEKNI